MLAVIGPSGGGKSSAVRLLAARAVLHVHPTWTTRPPRSDEVAGSIEHRFVSDEEFDDLCRAGFFLDTVAMFGLPFRYGLPPLTRCRDHCVDTVMLRAPLVDRFARHYPVVVFQIEDSPARTAARLRARGTSDVDVTARLGDNNAEVAAGRLIADRVFVNNASLDVLAGAVQAAWAEVGVAA